MGLLALLLCACTALNGPLVPCVGPYREIPPGVGADWLHGTLLRLEPFSSGSVQTPRTLEALPDKFRTKYPESASYRDLWARERDVAEYLHAEISRSLNRQLIARAPSVALEAAPAPSAMRWHYHASGHLELGHFRAVLFDPRASHLGDGSNGLDQLAPFRKAFLISKQPVPPRTMRFVTGYLGLHCAHQLLGRMNKDVVTTRLDWLAAVVDGEGRVVAQAYVGESSSARACPVRADYWDELVDGLVGRMLSATVVPAKP